MAVFVAPLDVARNVREQIEAAVADNLRKNHADCCTGRGTETGIRLEVTSDEAIAGLDSRLSS